MAVHNCTEVQERLYGIMFPVFMFIIYIVCIPPKDVLLNKCVMREDLHTGGK